MILAVFHFDNFWVNLGDLWFAGNQESKRSIIFEVDLIPVSCDSSFPVANHKGNVFGNNIYAPSVTVIAFILVKL